MNDTDPRYRYETAYSPTGRQTVTVRDDTGALLGKLQQLPKGGWLPARGDGLGRDDLPAIGLDFPDPQSALEWIKQGWRYA